jgi:hypothetical protein
MGQDELSKAPRPTRQPSYGTVEDQQTERNSTNGFQKECLGQTHEDSLTACSSSHQNSIDDVASDHGSQSSDPQTGVKKIEALSRTWTKWALFGAYVGYVFHFHSFERRMWYYVRRGFDGT